MNQEILKGQWQQVIGEAKIKWGKLSDQDLNVIDGEYDKLIGLIEEKYGYAKEEAEKQVKEFVETLKSKF